MILILGAGAAPLVFVTIIVPLYLRYNGVILGHSPANNYLIAPNGKAKTAMGKK